MRTRFALRRSEWFGVAGVAALSCAACVGNGVEASTVPCDTRSPDGGACSASGDGGSSGVDGSSGADGSPGRTAPSPDAIRGLFPTGVDAKGAVLAAGSVDPHYSMSSTDPALAGPGAIVVVPNAGVEYGWVANTTSSGWISPAANTWSATGDVFTYTTSFALADVDLAATRLSGTWACDDSCTMQLNGRQIASNPDPGWIAVRSFSIPAGSPFQVGRNTLVITVPNYGGMATGLQIVSIAGIAPPAAGDAGAGSDADATADASTPPAARGAR
jgi:hypothetical protein